VKNGPTSVAAYYEGWQVTNDRLIQTIGGLSDEQLGLTAAPHLWPIWATTAHLAGMRVYWLCTVFTEPGAEHTPFADPAADGWEDDLTHPRRPDELIGALESSWRIVERVLDHWTPEMLKDEFHRERDGKIQIHTRQAVLFRMLTHDAEHCGEISLTLGMHGLPGLDLWTGRAPTVLSRPQETRPATK
jgi:uncharacterized damage-inducible protein DinB